MVRAPFLSGKPQIMRFLQIIDIQNEVAIVIIIFVTLLIAVDSQWLCLYSCAMKREPPNPEEFDAIVWNIVRQVPSGKVTSYGQIASMIPAHPESDFEEHKRLSAYWVGQTMNRAREADQVPWQRVVNGQGKIAMPEGSAGALEQKKRLRDEAIIFSHKDKIDFQEFGWEGPNQAWLDQNGLLPPKTLKKTPPSSNNPEQMRLF